MRKKLLTFVLGIAMMLTLGVAVAQPASAGGLVSNLSVTVTKNMCPSGGSVSRVNVAITNPGTSGSTWNGNTVSGLQAFSGVNSEIIGSNYCSGWVWKGWYWQWVAYYKYWDVYRYFWSSGQTMYL